MDEAAKPDFSGWATKYGLKCTDGRTITKGAFEHQDGVEVPLVWQHNHDTPENVLGRVRLTHHDEGSRVDAFFNSTPKAQTAKALVVHKDIVALSIYANQLVEKSKQVFHGMIKEVSLVLGGANPGALIDYIRIQHDDGEIVTLTDEAYIYTGEPLIHSDDSDEESDDKEVDDKEVDDKVSHEDNSAALSALIDEKVKTALAVNKAVVVHESDEKEGQRMTRNIFEQKNGGEKDKKDKHVLSHDDMKSIAEDAKRRGGSLKEAVADYAVQHGIDDIEVLFPEARTVGGTPEFDTRRVEWVSGVLNGTKKSPFSRIKTRSADLTHEGARAKGYIKGTLKKEEFFGLLSRKTTPATVYKKQKLDRDDILDITDFDVVAWLKAEMRMMLDEEIARAILIGDGRAIDDEDKIKDPGMPGSTDNEGIRSILHDDDLYAATITVDDTADALATVDAIVTDLSLYKGSGSPTFYTTIPVLTGFMLKRDSFGHRVWRTPAELAAELGVANIVTVEVMEEETQLIGIIVNLNDYTVGTDQGGEVNFFDFFDIDYNQYKYLYETRLSGALTKIRSALVLMRATSAAGTLATPVEPAFDGTVVTVPTTTGVVYKRTDTGATLTTGAPVTLTSGQTLTVEATPDSTHYFADNVHDEWTFTNEA